MKLFYRKLGQGKPLIILHGLFGMSDNWLPIARKLSDRFEVYLPDLRNHGQSPHHPEFNYDVLVSDLHIFIQEHNLQNICLAGHSLGGKTAMQYTLKFPNNINKLAVMDIGTKTYNHSFLKSLLEIILKTDLRIIKSFSQADSELAKSITTPYVRQFLLKNLKRREDETFKWKFNAPVLYDNIERIHAGLAEDQTYDKSTLFVRGGKSDYIPDEDIPGIKKTFPSADIRTIDNASHWIHTDAHNELCDILTVYFG